MCKKKDKEKKKSRVGAFFGGTFFGFVLCLGAIIGLGCLVYFKVSINWINKTFKTNISLGSEQVESKTFGELVTELSGIVKNKDTYTLNDLNNDFGIKIKDEYMGIKITDIKDVPLTELSSAIQNKFGTISADELRNVNGMNLDSEMGNILSKSNTYYFNSADSKLYNNFEDTVYSNPVTFDYAVNAEKTVVTTKEHASTITAGQVEIELWYLPLTSALGDFTKNLGENITLGELQSQYGVNLPSFLQAKMGEKNANKTVNDLSNLIDGLYVGELLNYTVDASSATGDTDYNNIIVKDNGVNITGAIGKLSKLKVGNIKTGIDSLIQTLTLTEVFGTKTGALALINGNPTISALPEVLSEVINNASIQDLIDKGVVILSQENEEKLDNAISYNSKTMVGQLTVSELFDYCLSLIP